ncbi:MAG: Uma2 family endonuclease [Bryobacteraceae bacterium]
MSTLPKTYLTPEEYLEIERKAEYKSEYYQGEMLAMAGASMAHNRVVGNTFAVLWQQLESRQCEVFMGDQRVHVRATGLYAYPDVVAYCGDPQLLDTHMDTLLNPSLIVEVLSPSTETYDRNLKFEQYKSIESLREYLLVSSEQARADLHTRQPDGQWLLTSVSRLEDTLEIPSLGCMLRLADLYKKVKF